ncbi:MAG: glycosyltransferase [Candidatus Altiarchaeota archaeon]|nr:glycosyltransferase [Candidatus Altiarchaeota archaeon]
MDSSDNPLVSVIMPSYNQGKYIEQSILSVLNQDYKNIEFIVVDGGSTDETVDILKRYSDRINYWVSEKDAGQSDALNKGFSISKGLIQTYLNSDDLLYATAVNDAVKALQDNPDVDVVYSNIHLIDDRGKVVDLCFPPKFRFKDYLFFGFPIPQQASFWRNEVYDAVGGFNTKNHICMDHEFYIKAAEKGFSFMHINRISAAFRLHKGSKTCSNNRRLLKDELNRIAQNSNSGVDRRLFNLYRVYYRLKYIPSRMLTKIRFYTKNYDQKGSRV